MFSRLIFQTEKNILQINSLQRKSPHCFAYYHSPNQQFYHISQVDILFSKRNGSNFLCNFLLDLLSIDLFQKNFLFTWSAVWFLKSLRLLCSSCFRLRGRGAFPEFSVVIRMGKHENLSLILRSSFFCGRCPWGFCVTVIQSLAAAMCLG